MNKNCFSVVSDVIFVFVTSFLLFCALLRHIAEDFWQSAAVSLLLSLGISILLAKIRFSRVKKERVRRNERAEYERFSEQLTVLSVGEVNGVLADYFSANGAAVEERNGILYADGRAVLPVFRFSEVTADEVASLLRHCGGEEFAIVHRGMTEEALRLCDRFKIRRINADGVFAVLKKAGMLPEIIPQLSTLPQKRFARLGALLKKSMAKRYAYSGGCIVGVSFLSVYPPYYWVVGAVLLVFAVFLRIFGKDA